MLRAALDPAGDAAPGGEVGAWLTLVGIGEDGLDGLSSAARQAIAQAELVVGGRRHLDLIGRVAAETLAWRSPIEGTVPEILARRPRPVCVLASGDPFCFGVGPLLTRPLRAGEWRCHPRPSAFSLAAARLGWPLQDCTLVSLCGRPLETLIPALRPRSRVMVLSADATTPAAVVALLHARGYGRSRVVLCEALGGPRERIRAVAADDFSSDGIDPLNMLCLDLVAGPDAPLPSLVPGRPDAGFEHDGQITKAEVRAITLARLAPRPGELLWDVGAGSGSVAIEWMLAHPANRAVAIERRPDRAARIRRNAAQHGVPGLVVIEGTAPDACAGLPAPDAVFVGGGAGRGVIDMVGAGLGPGGRLVVNAVTLETEAVLLALFQDRGGALARIALARAEPVGGLHGWRPAMPVLQWCWVKP